MKIKQWWRARTQNEKIMWGLIIVLLIAILTRWDYVWSEIAQAFNSYFE